MDEILGRVHSNRRDCVCRCGRAAVPSGAPTGAREALELHDGDPARFFAGPAAFARG